MKKYFVRLGSKQYGPATMEELKKMNIGRDTLVWYKGLSKWTPAGEVPEISDVLFGSSGSRAVATISSSSSFGQAGRPAPQKRRTQTSIQDIVNDFSSEEKKVKGKRVMWVAVLAIAFGAFFAFDKFKNEPGTSSTPVVDTPTSPIEERVEQKMERKTSKSNEAAYPINYITIKTKLEGTNVTATITNTASTTTFKDVSFVVFYENANGTSLDQEEFTVNDRIAPGETAKFKFRANAPGNASKAEAIFSEAKAENYE